MSLRQRTATMNRALWKGKPKFALLVASLVLLSACSAVRVAYQQLDWLLERQAAKYVTLDDDQRRRLQAHIDSLLAWHCRTQVHGYGVWLRTVNDDFQHPVSLDRLQTHADALEDAWFRIMAQSIPMLVELATSLSDEQVSELLSGLERKNKEYRAEYVDPPEAELRRNAAKWMRKALKRWVGRLNPTQKQAVSEWSQRLLLMGDTGWRNRERWQRELVAVLERRHDREAVTAGLERLLLRWREHQDADYNRRYDANSELTAALLVEISRDLSPRQRARLEKKALGYAADLDSLDCSTDEQRTTAHGGMAGQPLAAH